MKIGETSYFEFKKIKIVIIWDLELKYFSFAFRKKRILSIKWMDGITIGFFDKTYM